MAKDQKCLGCQIDAAALGKRPASIGPRLSPSPALAPPTKASETLAAAALARQPAPGLPPPPVHASDHFDPSAKETVAGESKALDPLPESQSKASTSAKPPTGKKFDALSLLSGEQPGEEESLYSKTLIKKRP